MATDFDEIDRQSEDLEARLEGCRQAILLSRLAIAGSVALLALVLTVAGTFRTPVVVFSAIAAALAGTVWLGASKSSLRELEEQLRSLDAIRNRMIDKVAAANGWRDHTTTVH